MTQSAKWFWLSVVAGSILIVYLLAPVLTPFLVGAILGYMGDPLVDRLEKRFSRSLSVSIVFVLIIGVIALLMFILLPLIQQQISHFFSKVPVYLERIQTVFLPWLSATLGIGQLELPLGDIKASLAEQLPKAGGAAAQVVKTVSASGLALVGVLANILLIPVLTFYLLRDWDILVARIQELLPRHVEPEISRLARESDEVLGSFLRGQLLVMVCLGTIYSVGLWIVGLDFSLLIGMLAGLVSFVPYLGFTVGILVAGVAAMLQFQEASILLPVLAVFGVGQILESFALTPWFVGDRIGLHPVAVIFAVMAGGQLFGFFGVLLALPVAAVVMVLLRHVHERYVQSTLYERRKTKRDEVEPS